MLRWFQRRPVVGGVATIIAIGSVSLLAVARGWPAGVASASILIACVATCGLFVLGPALAARKAEAARRERASRALSAAGHASGRALDDEPGADIEALLAAVAESVPLARRDAEVAEASRITALSVLESIRVPVIGTDLEGRIVAGNALAEGLFAAGAAGLPRGLTGRNIAEVITQREVLELHREAASGKAASGEVRWLAPTGARTVEVSATPWQRGAEAVGVVMSMVDVTEVSEAARLRTDFVANASHELRTPLSAIKGAIETLESGAAEEPEIRSRLLRMIAENSARLEDLTRDLLDLSRLERTGASAEISTVRLSELEGSMRAQFASTLSQGTVKLVFRMGLGEVRTDPRLIQLILRNLIENALKFAYEGTEVVVSAERLSGGAVRWSVADRGIGIPLDQQQRIFERFYQVESSRTGNGPKGTGLGLAIVRHAVKSLDGTVRVESVWKEGTTMIVELPEPTEE